MRRYRLIFITLLRICIYSRGEIDGGGVPFKFVSWKFRQHAKRCAGNEPSRGKCRTVSAIVILFPLIKYKCGVRRKQVTSAMVDSDCPTARGSCPSFLYNFSPSLNY